MKHIAYPQHECHVALLDIERVKVHVEAADKRCGVTSVEIDVIWYAGVDVIVDQLLDWRCGKATLAINGNQTLGIHLEEHVIFAVKHADYEFS